MKLDLADAGRRLGSSVSFHAAPGGEDRKTLICLVDSERVALSQRRSRARARLEAEILGRLGDTGLTPKLLRCQDDLLVQEYVEGDRLPVALAKATEPERQDLIRRSAEALLEAQRAGHAAGLSAMVPEIGRRAGWEADLAASPLRLGEMLGLAVPAYDFGDLLTGAPTGEARFIKWDARPGNFIVRPNKSICLIDWEHAGRRRPLDDLAWFFADEWMPAAPEAMAACCNSLSGDKAPEDILRRCKAMAVAHAAIRLGLIFSRKAAGPWWRWDSCLWNDRIGVTPLHVKHLSRRAADWAGTVAGLGPLATLFLAIPEIIETAGRGRQD